MSLRTLYDEASLWMTPSGYEDGKLFSELPTDGSGDFTFSRGSNLAATRVDVNGLIEKGRENFLLDSNNFGTSNWLNYQLTRAGGQSGYDGSNDAWIFTKTATGFANIRQAFTAISGVYTYSAYIKAGTNTSVIMRCLGTSDHQWAIDLSNGTTLYSTTNLIDTNIEDVGSGWYRCSMAFNANAVSNTYFYPEYPFNGTTAGSIYVQDAQLEAGLVATDYIETGASTAQAGILEDMPRLDYSGGASCPALLLEPQRTNILAYSEGMFDSSYFFPINGISVEGQQTDLNGTNTAVKLSNFIAGASRLDYNTAVAAVDGKTYTYSAYYKGSGNININVSTSTGVGGAGEKTITLTNEWVRHSITATFSNPTGNVKSHLAITRTANNDAEVYLCFAQLEEGSYPTSYIPTYGSSVTRSLESLSVSNIQTNNLIGANQGSFVFHYKPYNAYTGSAGKIYDFRIDSNNRMATYFSNGTLRLFSNIAGATNFNQATTLDGDTEFKIGVGYDADSTLVYINGTLTYTLNGFDLGVTEFDISPPADGSKVGDFSWFPTKLTDSECIALTTI